MKLLVLLLVFPLYSCNQSSNSNSFDRSYSENIQINRSTPAGERLYQAYTVLEKKCMSCHTGYHNSWTSNNTDLLWIQSGLVIQNDPFSSSLVIRLKNTGGNMPKDNPQISEDDYNIIIDWISAL